MNYKDVLIDSQKSAVSAYTTFIYEYVNYNNAVVNFVEGQDYTYYNCRVKELINDNYEILFYPCNGRDEVETVKNMIEKNCKFNKNVKFMYFADKDYNIKERKENIYYTDYYSLENFYCQKEFIKNILKDIFNISIFNPDFNICMDLFTERYNKYYNEITKINCYAYIIRKKEYDNKIKRSNFSSIKFRKLVKNIEFDSFEMIHLDYESIRNLFDCNISVSELEYQNSLSSINEYNLRGKWEIQFYIWFLNGLKQCINNGDYNLSKNERIKVSFEHLMVCFPSQAITTDSLKKYINDCLNLK